MKKLKLKKSTIVFMVLDFLALSGFFLAYGPWSYLRNKYILTAMNTMNHQYYANVFYSKKTIDKIINSNYFIPLDEAVKLEDIVIDTGPKTTYKNEYDEQILKRDNPNDKYKIIDIKLNSMTKAKIVAIYDPKNVKLVRKEVLGTTNGEKLTSMCNRYKSQGFEIGVNGGRFEDVTGYGSGIPMGYVIEDGKIVWQDGPSNSARGSIIGITDEGKLLLMANATGDEALAAGVKEALEFGPFLIVNGEPIRSVGDGFQSSPRSAIAQRKDGVMLFLVVDGELYVDGATLLDLVNVLVKYGAYNAANLDGGQSTSLVNNECKLINSPPSAAKANGGRGIVTGFAYFNK